MMEPKNHHIVIFGDNINSVIPTIARLSRLATQSAIVRSFLEQAYESVRGILYESRQDMRDELGEFDNLLDLATWSTKHANTEMAIFIPLVCAAQLGTYLADYLLGDDVLMTVPPSNETLLGSRVGLLSAAAVACSHSLGNLISISPQVLAVAVRLGVSMDRRSTAIAGNSGFFSVTVSKDPSGIRQALDVFNKSQLLPDIMRPFISQESASLVTISVTRPVLDTLLDNLRKQRYSFQTYQDGMATLHGAKLPSLDIDYIVGNFNSDDWSSKPRFRMRTLLSPCSGAPYVAETRQSLFGSIISDLVSKTALWDKVGHQVRDRLNTQSALFLAMGSSEMGSSIYHGLRAQGCNISHYPHDNHNEPISPSDRELAQDIAIVGYSSRLPSSESSDEFWEILKAGRDVHGRMPSSRCAGFGVEPPLGCFYDNLDQFDCQLFNMSPREAAQTDPGQRLILMVTYEALQMAGYSPGTTASTHRRRVGTFFGQTTDDWREYNVVDDIDMFYVPGTIRAFGPGRLNYYFKWDGPSYSFDTACSSSSVAVQMAFTSLRNQECDMAVAGGLNTLTGPSMFAGLSQGRFLSTTGCCKTFDSKADGYCRADGVGVVILKRLDRALQDKDNIYGIIKSAVTNHSARAISITQPHSNTQARLFQKALSIANLGPSDISYVEMHGTGTPVGDSAELTSVLSVFGQQRNVDDPLYIGAAKANVGHGEAAAGITSIIKALLMFKYSEVPPHVGIKSQANTLLQALDSANIKVPLSAVDFANPPTEESRRRRIMVNNFSAAGGNTCLLLEEGLCQPQSHTKDPRTYHVVVLSAQNLASLKSNTERLLSYLAGRPSQRMLPAQSSPALLPDVAYTTTARRMHHSLRKSFVVANTDELSSALQHSLTNWTNPKRRSNTPSIALLFTGQGADVLGVGKQLLDTCKVFRASMEECEELAHSCGYPSFLALIRNPEEVSAPTPIQSQLAIVSLELSMARLLLSYGVKPTVVCGHSLGEYAALCFSGAITTAAMIYLVGYRANLVMGLCSAGTHLMLAVRSSVTSIEETISRLDLRFTEIACMNSPTDTVVAGPDHEIKLLETSLRDLHISCLQLKAPYAFHTAQMNPVLEPLSDAARSIPFARPTTPFASTLLSRVITEKEDFTPDYFSQQCRLQVRMTATLSDVQARGLVDENTIWIECGPHPLCLPMVAAITSLKASRERCLPCFKRQTDDWRNLGSILATSFDMGIRIDWAEYHHEYQHGLHLAQIPTYAFDLKRYWHSPKPAADVTLPDRSRVAKAKQQPAEIFRPILCSALLHRVEKDEIDSLGVSGRIEFSSNLNRDTPLRTMAQGHQVHGHCLVPTSVYTEMALSAAFFRYQRVERRTLLPADYAFSLIDLVISQPLVVHGGASRDDQLVRVSTWSKGETNHVNVEISSCLDPAGNGRLLLHASCRVEIVPFANAGRWRAAGSDALSGRQSFLSETKTGGTSVLQQSSIYRLFRSIVTYHEQYFGMQDMTIHNDRPEAISTFQFRKTNDNASCLYSPYRSDSIAQLAGFLMNVLFSVSPDKAYISNGWERLYLMEPLLEDVIYLAHAKVSEVTSGTISFTVSVITPDAKVVAICQGLKFKEIDRKTLLLVLDNANRGSRRHQSASLNVLNGLGISKTGIVGPTKQVRPEPETRSRALPQPKRVPVSFQHTSPASPTIILAREEGQSHNSQKADTSILSHIMSTMASETGYDNIIWEDNMSFAEFGVDSMISMAIIHKIHSKTGCQLPSTVFHEYPTLAELRSYLETNGMAHQTPNSRSNRGSVSSYRQTDTLEDAEERMQLSLRTTAVSSHTLLSRPIEQYSTPSISRYHTPSISRYPTPSIERYPTPSMPRCPTPSERYPTPSIDHYPTPMSDRTVETLPPRGEHLFSSLRSVLCTEMGVTEEELDEDVSLQELGLDSMLTFSVLCRLRQQLDWEPSSTFFLEHNTLRLVRKVLAAGDLGEDKPAFDRAISTRERQLSPHSPPDGLPRGPSYDLTGNLKTGDASYDFPDNIKTSTQLWQTSTINDTSLHDFHSRSTILSGAPTSDTRALFLVPDGTGSGLAYVFVANALKSLYTTSAQTTPVLCALDSPFLAQPEEYLQRRVSVPQLAAIYLREVRRIQPRGPYRLGGWSIGGIHAFEMAHQLSVAGEKVELLCLIDSPCPTVLSPCSIEVIFEGIGLPAANVPLPLKQHVNANLASLERYQPPYHDGVPIAQSCLAVWAGRPLKQGEAKSSLHEMSRAQKAKNWFFYQRKDFGACGWDGVTGAQMRVHVIKGATHFDIVKGESAKELAALISSMLM